MALRQSWNGWIASASLLGAVVALLAAALARRGRSGAREGAAASQATRPE